MTKHDHAFQASFLSTLSDNKRESWYQLNQGRYRLNTEKPHKPPFLFEKQPSLKFRKIHRKTPVLESPFNKAAGPKNDSSTGNFPVNLQNF